VRGQILLYRGSLRRMTVFPDGEYVVPRRGGRLLFGSTLEHAGFDPRPTREACAHLAERARELLGLDPGDQLAAWAGLRPGTQELLPYIGRDPRRPDLLHASGHYRNGILLAPLTARIVADLACGRDPGHDLGPFAPPA
jgi:glycine oxidase